VKSARAFDYLTHMIEAIDRIAIYTAGLTPEIFLQTTLVQDAVVRNFEIIGEAARNIAREAPELTAAHSDIPWSVISAMRNRLAHGYFSVDFESVWAPARDDLPSLRAQIETVVRSLPQVR
jgi:uncharacterized protein with HEPN domain